MVAGKEMGEDEWAAWDARYQQAAADLEHRDDLVSRDLWSTLCLHRLCCSHPASVTAVAAPREWPAAGRKSSGTWSVFFNPKTLNPKP